MSTSHYNPHEFRKAFSRGSIQGRRAAQNKSYGACPYNASFANRMKKSASRLASAATQRVQQWNLGFEEQAGRKWKKYEKPSKFAVKEN